ncbi:hypothetical protein [Natrinema versiforme]|uniref:Envelope protein N-terminal domain-containing protein n=1 Tax=Natrinema versiforme TaxID=88724 RepID=A0A4V1FZQ3_9EURY|nr:hypothetical protein [Natrinema versiforme]QCS42646.1 hypothetical protein FEJ81_09855 [Natrinema versiforme]
MTAHSPRPIAHRAFTVLLAFLLVGSVVAPIAAAEPAAAQEDDGWIDGSYEGTCDSNLRFAFPISCGHSSFSADQIDTSQDTAAIEADTHVSAQSVKESWDAQDTVYQNYLQDTETLASLEARNEIAESYQNNQSAAAASADASRAISDYYSVHQRNLLEISSQHTARLDYLINVSKQQSEMDDRFIAPYSTGTMTYYDAHMESMDWEGTADGTYELANGTTYDVVYPQLYVNGNGGSVTSSDSSWSAVASLEDYNETSETIDMPYNGGDTAMEGDTTMKWVPGMSVMNVPEAGLEADTAYDYRLVGERLYQLEQQAQTVKNNYDASVAEDLYAAMDSGDLDPNEVRGAEGMVRYMSGADNESNVTEDRFSLALRSTLDLAGTDLDSTMVVEFEGATERERIASEDGSVSYEYNSVNETYEGLLFSSETPVNGFQKGETYDVSNLDGTTTMVTDGGANETTFYQGNLTITTIYDSDGNEVEDVNWKDPTYDEYNATAYIEALEEASQQREQIVSEDDGDSGSDVTISNPFEGVGAGGAVVGLVVIVAGVAVVVIVVIRP